MGICYAEKNKLNKKLFSGELYSNFDKIVFLQKFFMENNLSKEEISSFFTSIIYDQIIQEKNNKTKHRRFYKWYEKAFMPYHNLLSSLQKDSILKSLNTEKEKSLKKQKENEEDSTYSEIPNFSQDISISEQGLRNYYFSNQLHFENRVLKCPPASFRWISWLIISGIPISRPAVYYTNLLTYDLPEKVEEQIQKDLNRTVKLNENNYKEKINSLYRLLRAMANLDKGLGYTQGMNFLVYYLLNISNRNEIDVFYLLMTIFSHTFSKKYGMRSFFIDDFPLLYTCTNIFDKNLNKHLPEIHKHIKSINLTPFSWISFWMQQIYTIVFPKEILLRVWDFFFVYGLNFLISFGISLVDYFQDQLIKIKDIVEFQNFFKLLNNIDTDKIDKIRNKTKIIPREYDIEKILKNSIEKYYINSEEIETDLKKNYPNYNSEFVYDYKSIESNPDVKSDYVIYALNNSKALSSKKQFSTSYDSTFRNSSNQKNETKLKSNNKSEKKDNKNVIISNIQEEDDNCDIYEEEIEDDNDLHSHIKEIVLKHSDAKFKFRK